MKTIGTIVVTIALVIYAVLFGGWVTLSLYEWLVIPVLGWPKIPLIHMIALVAFVNHVRGATTESPKKETKDSDEIGAFLFVGFMKVTLTGLITLFFAWILSLFL